MSTRSNICFLDKEGKEQVVYCHFDGYLTGIGQILLKHYDTEEKVKKLLSGGSISSIDDSGSADYYASRGEELKVYDISSEEEAKDLIGVFIEYVYMFKNGKWFYIDGEDVKNFKELTQEVIDKENE